MTTRSGEIASRRGLLFRVSLGRREYQGRNATEQGNESLLQHKSLKVKRDVWLRWPRVLQRFVFRSNRTQSCMRPVAGYSGSCPSERRRSVVAGLITRFCFMEGDCRA